MKRNVVPLLAIAFIVAAISTGVFYGVFAGRLRAASTDMPQRPLVVAAHELQRGTVLKPEDLRVSEMRTRTPFKGSFDAPQKLIGAIVVEAMMENEPFTDSRVALKDSASGSTNGVPSGMRAVSIHVYESSGIIGLIRRGSKVDVQAVSERSGTVELSPILQDIEVLAVNPQPEQVLGGRSSAPVVTVLTRPFDTDIVALADSGTRLRLALRNPLDDTTDSRKTLGVPALFHEGSNRLPVQPHQTSVATPGGRGQ
jgi:pilus assembly protein CpaB